MTQKPLFFMILAAVLSCGLMAGIFFTFSVFVMKALGQLPANQGIAAMQRINVVILNPLFFAVFFGSTIACLYALGFSLRHWQTPGAIYLLAGSAIYLLGSFLVTTVFNVPLNDALAAVSPQSPQGAHVWASYLTTWTAWNHVRTLSSLGATACFAFALWV